MTVQDAIKHLKDLDASGRITGVLDDRGKYICISPEELGKVAQFITKRGRVSRTYVASTPPSSLFAAGFGGLLTCTHGSHRSRRDLAAASNRLVDLNPRKRVDAGDIPADVFAADLEPPQAIAATATS